MSHLSALCSGFVNEPTWAELIRRHPVPSVRRFANMHEQKGNNMSNNALLIIDVQNDFCTGGSLAVQNTDSLIPEINKLIVDFSKETSDLIIGTQDWHPKNHGSFASNNNTKPFEKGLLNGIEQIFWPDHCIENTPGAEFHKDLLDIPTIFQKGLDSSVDSYSGFFDNCGKNPSGLNDYLKENKITKLFLCGIATDYCVNYTCLDALKLGYEVIVLKYACRGVQDITSDLAIAEMHKNGAIIIE